MLKIPDILDNKSFLEVPLDYKWEDKTSTFYYVDAHNENIGRALWALNHKATFGIATALAEWVFWRLSTHIKPKMINLSLESQWAGIIDKHYFIDWNFDKEYQSNLVQGPIWVMLKCLQYPREAYVNGYIFINKKIPNLAMLARHISPDQKLFDKWFSHILKKAAELFPARYDYAKILSDLNNRGDDIYDSSDEPPIPRAFFWDYDYNTVNNEAQFNQFLSSLTYEDNQFLNKPQKMLEEGFTGIPYHYKES